MSKRLTLFLTLVVLGLGAWAYHLYRDENPDALSHLIKKEGEPDYIGNRMTSVVYNLAGQTQYWVSADEIKYYEVREHTEFVQPRLELLETGLALKQWRISAQNAQLSRDKILFLRGDVRIESLDKTSRLQKIETESLQLDLNTQDIFSDSIVKSSGLGFITEGKGLTGNLKKQVATLTQNVKSAIEPVVIQRHSVN